jgi:hypothetical protein
MNGWKMVILCTCLVMNSILAQENKAQGSNSTIVEVDGYAFLSEDKTIREIRDEALSNAKRDALERVQTYIKSLTTVENYQLKYDLIQSGAEGFLKIIERKDYGITEDNRYRIWIRAEVNYRVAAPDFSGNFDISQASAAPLHVSVWTDRKEYVSIDKIKIFIRGNKDFYARILYKDASGNILQVLPNQHRNNHFFTGGKLYEIPDREDKFELEVSAPFGKESIIVYASDEPLGGITMSKYGDAVFKIAGDLTEIGRKTRGIKIREKPAEFYEATCELTTKK